MPVNRFPEYFGIPTLLLAFQVGALLVLVQKVEVLCAVCVAPDVGFRVQDEGVLVVYGVGFKGLAIRFEASFAAIYTARVLLGFVRADLCVGQQC